MGQYSVFRWPLLVVGAGAIAISRRQAPVMDSVVNIESTLRNENADIDANSLCYDSNVDGLPFFVTDRTKMVLTVHRKTGFVMADHTAKCFNGTFTRAEGKVAMKYNGSTKVVHISRDPMDWIMSNYLYNRFTSRERGTLMAGTAGHHMHRCRKWGQYVADTLPETGENESLREYLERIPEKSSLIFTMCESIFAVSKMVVVSAWCNSNEDCLEVSLSNFTQSSESFWITWKTITDLAGETLSEQLRECLKKQDVHSHKFQGEDHCTSNKALPDERERLMKLAARIDREFFDGYYAKAASDQQVLRSRLSPPALRNHG